MANGQISLSTNDLERYITRLDTENQEFETIRNGIISDLEQLQSVIKISGFSEITNELQSKLRSATGTIRANMAVCNNFMKKQLIEYTENSGLTSERLANISEGLKGISHVANATPESVAGVTGTSVGMNSSAYNQKLEVMEKKINPSFQTTKDMNERLEFTETRLDKSSATANDASTSGVKTNDYWDKYYGSNDTSSSQQTVNTPNTSNNSQSFINNPVTQNENLQNAFSNVETAKNNLNVAETEYKTGGYSSTEEWKSYQSARNDFNQAQYNANKIATDSIIDDSSFVVNHPISNN